MREGGERCTLSAGPAPLRRSCGVPGGKDATGQAQRSVCTSPHNHVASLPLSRGTEPVLREQLRGRVVYLEVDQRVQLAEADGDRRAGGRGVAAQLQQRGHTAGRRDCGLGQGREHTHCTGGWVGDQDFAFLQVITF